MYKDLVKDAFIEGRVVGGEFTDSDSKLVSELINIDDIDNVKIRRMSNTGKSGRTFANINSVKVYIRDELNQAFHKSNFITALLGGWNSNGYKWEVVV